MGRSETTHEETVGALLFGELGGKSGNELHLCVCSDQRVQSSARVDVKEEARRRTVLRVVRPRDCVRILGLASPPSLERRKTAKRGVGRTDDVLERSLRVNTKALCDGLDPVGAEGALGVDEGDCRRDKSVIELSRGRIGRWEGRREGRTHPCPRRLPCRRGAGSSVPARLGVSSVSLRVGKEEDARRKACD